MNTYKIARDVHVIWICNELCLLFRTEAISARSDRASHWRPQLWQETENEPYTDS